MLSDGGASTGTAERDALVDPRRVFHRIPGATREEVLEDLAARLAADGSVADPAELARRLIDRERIGCTGLGGGVAIPHCKLRGLAEIVVALATTAMPIDFGAPDGRPIDVIFVVASPAEAPAAHLQILARISRLIRATGLPDALRAADSAAAEVEALKMAEAGLAVMR